MRRILSRIFVIVATLAVAPHAVEAQQQRKVHRVGVLIPSGWEETAFRQTLRELGYVEGSNLVLDVRLAERNLDRLPALARELVSNAPDVIVAANTPGTQAAMDATKTIPIVMVGVGDPVATGFVSNLARPDGNVTGISNLCGALGAKRLALLKEAVPAARRIAVMLNSNDPITTQQVKDIERAAPTIGAQVRFFPARSTAEVAPAFELLRKWPADAVLWLCGQQTGLEEPAIALATKHRLPVMPYLASSIKAGGLMTYANTNPEMYRRTAQYVDKILKGARPADLPVEQPTKLVLTLNLKIAKALGLTFPPAILVRADEVVQ